MDLIDKAAAFIKNQQVEVIGKDAKQIIIQVGEHQVIMTKKDGRTLDSCSCQNHAKFCKENPRCSHKLAVATYMVMRRVKWDKTKY